LSLNDRFGFLNRIYLTHIGSWHIPNPQDEVRRMTFTPIDLMLRRVHKAGSDSDTALFLELLYAGEFILKMTTAAFVASIEDDREGHRYRLMHTLVRADGIGE